MRWRRTLTLSALLATVPAVAQAETELSVGDRLQDRREVAAGTRAYSVGFQDGRFYANGWHITGEMGGIWAAPQKLADGIWFGVDDAWAGAATKFTSGRGYVRYDLPDASGLKLRRTDFSPDGTRAVLYGLELTNPGGAPKTVTVKVDAHSELMTAYPWAWTMPNAGEANGADTGAVRDGALAFSDGALTSFVASDRRADGAETGPGHWGAQPGTACDPATNPTSLPSACDDGPFGKGTGGQLRYTVTVRPGRPETVWIAVAATRQDLTGALRDPGRQLAEKAGDRARLGEYSKLDLPGDRQLQEAVDWGKQNLADLTQTATDLNLRFVDEGKVANPPTIAKIPQVTFFGAGYPDYPWLFATDGEYTAFAAVALGQFETAKAHLIALRDISDALNDRSGKVAHEIVTDGSVYYGANSNPGNTDETAKFPSAVALLWRWTGDDRFRDSLYDFSVRNLKYIVSTLDTDHDGWPEGLGNVERTGMGPEKLDNTVYFIRGLYDLADMAAAKHDRGTERWAGELADKLRSRFDPQWWHAASSQYADSLDENNGQIQQKHWIGVTPMEVELTDDGATVPGLAPADHGAAALAGREDPCYSGTAPFNPGLFHTGCGGGPTGAGEKIIYSLGNAIQAVGEGNYGRSAKRYTDANVVPMFQPDEQPGALPEVLPSPDQNANIDRCWSCRSMVMQAWGHYGTAWPVVHQQLGVRPSLGTGRLDVVPQVPDGQPSVAGRNIRLGDGSVDVAATARSTTVTVRTRLRELNLGLTLKSKAGRVKLDGRTVRKPDVRLTNRGYEVTVKAPPYGRHTLELAG